VITPKDKRVTAYHEAGHAIATHVLPEADPVHKLTIVSRGRAAGYMMPLPDDRSHYQRSYLLDRIAVLMAGRAAEEIAYGEVTTGAQNDFQQATDLARRMVVDWGMSEVIGPVSHGSSQELFLGRDFTEMRNYSEETAQLIDGEVKRICEDSYKRVKIVLEDHRDAMERVVEALIARETLVGEDFERVFNGETLPPLDLETPRQAGPEEEKEGEEERPFIPPRVVPNPN